MLENTTYYNIQNPINGFGCPNIETTITKIFLSLQSQVLNSFLWSQLFFLVAVLLTLEFTTNQDCLWGDINNKSIDSQRKKIKVLRALCYISLPLAIYGVLLCISIKLELNL
jgi:hypothetical protein